MKPLHKNSFKLTSRTGVALFRSFVVQSCFCLLFAFVLSATGCNKESQEVEQGGETFIEIPEPLTVLVVGDSGLGPRLERQWAARKDGELTIVDVTLVSFIESDFEIPPAIDVVVFAPLMLGDLVSRDLLMEVPDDVWTSETLNKNELLRHFRTLVVQHADGNWAVPLGSPCFSMICNEAVFERAEVEPPVSWNKMERCLRNLKTFIDETNAPKLLAEVDMPLAKGWAAHVFLARAAPAIAQRGRLSTVLDRQTMKPLIAELPFVEALEQLQSIATERSLDLTPRDVYELAISGDSSIALGWPARGFVDASEIDESQDAVENLRIVSLPGVTTWFDKTSGSWVKRGQDDQTKVDLIGFSGLIAGVSSQSQKEQTAWEFLEWLSSKSISLVTLTESPSVGPFRASHLGDASRWTGDRISEDVSDEYSEVVSANHDRPQAMIFPRLPSQHLYLEVLDKEVRLAVSGEKSAEASLAAVAEKWDAITDSIGRKAQIKRLKQTRGL